MEQSAHTPHLAAATDQGHFPPHAHMDTLSYIHPLLPANGGALSHLQGAALQGTVFRAVRSNPVLKKKADWAKKWMSR